MRTHYLTVIETFLRYPFCLLAAFFFHSLFVHSICPQHFSSSGGVHKRQSQSVRVIFHDTRSEMIVAGGCSSIAFGSRQQVRLCECASLLATRHHHQCQWTLFFIKVANYEQDKLMCLGSPLSLAMSSSFRQIEAAAITTARMTQEKAVAT